MKLDEATYHQDGRNVFSSDPDIPLAFAVCYHKDHAKHIVRALNELTERARETREECGT